MALALGVLPGPGRAGTADPSGVSDLLLPAAIILAPVIVPLNFLFGDKNPRLTAYAQKKADALLAEQKTPIPFKGMYTGGIDLSRAIEGMFVGGQIPFVEIDTAGSKWLIEQSGSPKPLVDQALENPYIRLELAQEGDPACFVWKSENNNWTQRIPVRPGTCLSVSFTKTLSSDVQVKVNTSNAGQGELLWEFSERATGKLLLAVPYWQGQMPDKTPRISPSYGPEFNADDHTRFAGSIRKFIASSRPMASDGRPYLLTWVYWSTREAPTTKVTAHVKVSDKLWPHDASRNDWKSAYRHAYETGNATLAGWKYILFPENNSVGKLRIDDFGFATLEKNLLFNMPRSADRVSATARASLLNGKAVWNLRIQPDVIPEQLLDRQGCSFRTSVVELSAEDLILKGNIYCSAGEAIGTEWIISRTSLPPVPGTD